MTAERVAAEQDDVEQQHERADADAEVPGARRILNTHEACSTS